MDWCSLAVAGALCLLAGVAYWWLLDPGRPRGEEERGLSRAARRLHLKFRTRRQPFGPLLVGHIGKLHVEVTPGDSSTGLRLALPRAVGELPPTASPKAALEAVYAAAPAATAELHRDTLTVDCGERLVDEDRLVALIEASVRLGEAIVDEKKRH